MINDRLHVRGSAAPADSPYVELHAHSAFSFLRAGSSVEALVARAAALGMSALALTDYMTLAGVVRFQIACARHGIRPIAGCELAVADPVFGDAPSPARLIVLAENPTGYARLCTLLTDANLAQPAAPVVRFAALAERPEGLIVLTGGRGGALARLLLAGRRSAAEELACRYAAAFGRERIFVEVQHHALPESVHLLEQLAAIAAVAELRLVVTNGVHYATRDDYALYDLLSCVRLGVTVDRAHPERPATDEAFLKDGAELTPSFAGFPWAAQALATPEEIAGRCDLALLKAVCTAPRVPLPVGQTPTTRLSALCEAGLSEYYAASQPDALSAASPQRCQLDHELAVIGQLGLEEFFLCVHQICDAARRMGIRCSGRGSAANSLVAYLLHITGVDPIQHKLLFERFLNPDRQGMPDIDIDVQSDRREELIRYVERTYTHEHAAMVANVITYRPRLALRDTAKALGFPLELVNRLAKVPHHHAVPRDLPVLRDELAQVVRDFPLAETIRARCLARLPLLLDLAARLCGLPRHLSLHNGGMVLTREPLLNLLPVRVSANGVRALEVDKDDVERLGLIKFDLLGLRTLGAIEEALTLIQETTGARPDLDALPTDPPDEATMRLIRAGQTLAVFQIESPGQWHLLAQTQPRTLDDLIVQTALFRPGPIQGGFVHPYVERRQAQQAHQALAPSFAEVPDGRSPSPPSLRGKGARGKGARGLGQRDAVQSPWHGAPADDFWTHHPVLGPILRDTEGILLFQEQILEIAHSFADLSYADADGFRRAMSHARHPAEMEAMRARFISGATGRGETADAAARVFDAIANFVGYGFCRSHAAEFGKTIYATAWLKAHYPAHYLAAFLSAQPAGFFPPHVVLEEAKQLGIPVLPPDVNRGEDRFTVERVGTASRQRWAIRIGLRQVAQVGEELAEAILWERQRDREAGADGEWPFASLGDLCARLRPAGLDRRAAAALVLSGACDSLPPRMTRRQRLWQLHELWQYVDPSGSAARARKRRRPHDVVGGLPPAPQQLTLTWESAPNFAAVSPEGVVAPPLPAFSRDEAAALDEQLLGMSARPHPMRLLRSNLRRRGVRTIAELAGLPAGHGVHVAGWAISAQRPPTAKGMGFLVLEDETGRLPVAVPPRLAEQMYRVVREARVIGVAGRVERVRWYRSLLATELRVAG